MQNDTISRSALVAELECFKVAAGDVVLRVLIDRIIGIVKDQPEVEPVPLTLDEWDETDSQKLYDVAKAALAKVPDASPGIRDCAGCKHFDESASDYPCYLCTFRSDGEPTHWEAASHENL